MPGLQGYSSGVPRSPESSFNREVAADLVVSVSTVKKHIMNICGKLNVGGRTQAIAKAHALHAMSVPASPVSRCMMMQAVSKYNAVTLFSAIS
jgi:hypothetical protein